MKYILFLLSAFGFSIIQAQTYTSQDMTIQLDENGFASITSKDVLVNTKGTLVGINDDILNNLNFFEYNQEVNDLTFIEQRDFFCVGQSLTYSYDRNPINKQDYLTGLIIDAGDFLIPVNENIECLGDEILHYYRDASCDFNFDPPTLFSFDKDGVLYEATWTSNGIYTYDLHSNIRSFFAGSAITPVYSGITYDFENHRLITIESYNSLHHITAIDIETAETNILFTIPPPSGCAAVAVEYIGNNELLFASNDHLCGGIYSLNLVTQETQNLVSDSPGFSDFLFIEDEIENTTLSISEFSCDDLGENIVEITIVENGETTVLQSTVTVVPDFSTRNCPVLALLRTAPEGGGTSALVDDFTTEIDIVSSCSSNFTITQDPPAGTVVPEGELITVLLTITDEFNNTAFCSIEACSASTLSIDDISVLDRSLNIYPNPTHDLVTIENDENIVFSTILVQDMNGKVLKTKSLESITSKTSLSLEGLSDGIYFVQVNSEEGQAVRRIIKN